MQIAEPDAEEQIALELVSRVGKAFWDNIDGDDDTELVSEIEQELGMTCSEASEILGKRLRPN
jgi:hypothetical protein